MSRTTGSLSECENEHDQDNDSQLNDLVTSIGELEEEQQYKQVVENASFGFTAVTENNGNLSPPKPTGNLLTVVARRSSLGAIASIIAAHEQMDQKVKDVKAKAELKLKQRQERLAFLRAALTGAVLIDAVYILVSVPLRLGFFYDPWDNDIRERGNWTRALTVFSIMDILGETTRIGLFLWECESNSSSQRSGPRRSNVSFAKGLVPLLLSRRSMLSVMPMAEQVADLKEPAMSAADAVPLMQAPTQHHLSSIATILLCLPLEVVALALNYNWLHAARVLKFVVACRNFPWLFRSILKRNRNFHLVQKLSFSTLMLPFYLMWVGLYLCHVTACGYMLIAHIECGIDFSKCSGSVTPGCWVLRDKLEYGSLWRQYIRTMYWGSKTVTTLGQGDLAPATLFETQYCIIVQYISGLWATSFLSSCAFYFSCKDRDLDASVSMQLERALKFLRARSIPAELSDRIQSYHQYMQRTRKGTEEDIVLAHLPRHYQSQLSFHLVSKLLRKIPFFAKQPKSFLKTIFSMVENDFLSPRQTIFGVNDHEEMIMIGRGEIRVLDPDALRVVRVLGPGEHFADHALFQDTRSKYELVAGTFCEVYCLTRQSCLRALEIHYPKLRVTLILAQQRRTALVAGVLTDLPELIGRRTFLNSLQQRFHVLEHANRIPWHFPNSTFRLRWRRLKLVCLLYLATIVPFEIAFKWKSGLLNQSTDWTQCVNYIVSVLVELFFYVDVAFRCCKFVRVDESLLSQMIGKTVTQADALAKIVAHARASSMSSSTMSQSAQYGLIIEPAGIFQRYLDNDDVLADVFASLPISIIWYLLPKDHMSITLMFWMRFFRLLALGRLFQLRHVLDKLMVSSNFSPASRLLTQAIVFCALSANAVACCFYLVADTGGFVDALSPHYSNLEVLSLDACLESASLYGNCTWFMMDYNHFRINFRYLRAMHWSIDLLATVGYGDILSFSNGECVIGFWWIFLGALICYFTACTVSSVITQVTILDTIQSDRLMEINRTFVRANIPEATRAIIRTHYCTNWEFNGSTVEESSLMKHLPRSLRYQLASSLYLDDLARCETFANSREDKAFMKELTQLLRSQIFLPNIMLLDVGHLMSEMFLIQSGSVELLLLDREIQVSARSSYTKMILPRQPSRAQRLQSALAGLFRQHIPKLNHVLPTMLTIHHKISSKATMSLIPWRVIARGDAFATESLLDRDRFVAKVSARSLTTTQVAILERDAFLNLLDRFPIVGEQILEQIEDKKHQDAKLIKTIKKNLLQRYKVKAVLGAPHSLFNPIQAQRLHSEVISPESSFYAWWFALHGGILLYNFYQISFRVAFLPYPYPHNQRLISTVDYLCDAVLYVDIYLKWNHFGFMDHGAAIMDIALIRKRYWSGWMWMDCVSMVPLYYQGDFLYMTLARLPRLLKSLQLLEFTRTMEDHIRRRISKGRSSQMMLSVFDVIKFLVMFMSAGHQIGSLYFILGRGLISGGWVERSWMTVDFVLNQYPDDYMIQYFRALYWCMETFTVVCFGDVIAQNALETVLADITSVIGWMCIAQVTGQISSLMAVLDKDVHEHNERVNDFEHFAKVSKLPGFLRDRCIESLKYKAEYMLELNIRETFEDLPTALHKLLFDRLYGPYVRVIPEFMAVLTEPQLQAVANALTLDVYLAEDTIVEEGRIGSKLYIMKDGRAEIWSPQARVIFAAIHTGVLFGDLAFFLKGSRQMATIRAHSMCQVLSMHRRQWLQLWPDSVRLIIETRMAELMRQKYAAVASAYINILKNMQTRHGAPSTAFASTRSLKGNEPQDVVEMPTDALFAGLASRPTLAKHARRVVRNSFSIAPLLSSLKRQNTLQANDWLTKQKSRDLRKQLGLPINSDLWAASQMSVFASLRERFEKNLRVFTFSDELTDRANVARASSFSTRRRASSARRLSIQKEKQRNEESADEKKDKKPLKPLRQISIANSNQQGGTTTADEQHARRNSSAVVPSQVAVAEPIAISEARGETHSYMTHLETLKTRFKRIKTQGIFRTSHELDKGETAIEIWVQPPLPPSFWLETSTFRRVWNFVMLVICAYYILVIPFRASFDSVYLELPSYVPLVRAWFAFEYFLDALCVIDFVLCQTYFVLTRNGEFVTDSKQLRQHYMQEGTFFADLICILPLEVFLRRSTGASWYYHYSLLRMNKMLRIVHLHELGERVQRTLVYDWKLSSVSPSFVYFVRFAFDFALGAHWVACFFYFVAYKAFDPGHSSWLSTPGMLSFAGCNGRSEIHDVALQVKYARSYHFGMGAITTVSYGDIAPQNAAETVAGIFVIIVSFTLFGMLAGGFLQVFNMELGRRADYEERVATVAQYMMFHRFQARLWRQMQIYFAVHWQESKGMNEEQQLRGITTSVRLDVTLYVKREFVSQLTLFATCEETFVRAVVAAFEQELFVRNDVIISEGDTDRSLYVIESGSVLLRITKNPSSNPKPLAEDAKREDQTSDSNVIELVKRRFDFFGEKSLILDAPRSATCIAMCTCRLLLLTVHKYHEILQDFPEYREKNTRDWIFANSMINNSKFMRRMQASKKATPTA